MSFSESKPLNFLLLVGEDTGLHLGCYGDPMACTPTLDQLAQEGTRYTQAFCHAPVCAPSRGSLVTSQYPWSLGIHQMRSKLLQPPRLFTHELVQAGYDVFWPTKLDFNFEPSPGWCSSQEKWWEKGLPQDRPFFAYRNCELTHESRMWPEKQKKEGPLSIDPAQVPVPPYLPDLPEVRQQIAWYYHQLRRQDQVWRECLQALEASGQADHTVVIYLTDHGRGLPLEKRWCYEAGLHLPLIVRLPGSGQRGVVEDRVVSWVDLAPTILGLAGIKVPETYQGRDFLQASARPRTYHFAGRDRMGEAYDCQRSCRSEKFLYVRNFYPEIPWARRNQYQEQAPAVQAMRRAWAQGKLKGAEARYFSVERGAEELFALETDPHCLKNLAGQEEFEGVLREHRQALAEHLQEVGDWGAEPEERMVALGLVENQIEEYTKWLGSLPEEFAVEPAASSIQMPYARPAL
jgi:N-sulfoglucosamine sulfohydrolase